MNSSKYFLKRAVCSHAGALNHIVKRIFIDDSFKKQGYKREENPALLQASLYHKEKRSMIMHLHDIILG
jgi:hypothetical protein